MYEEFSSFITYSDSNIRNQVFTLGCIEGLLSENYYDGVYVYFPIQQYKLTENELSGVYEINTVTYNGKLCKQLAIEKQLLSLCEHDILYHYVEWFFGCMIIISKYNDDDTITIQCKHEYIKHKILTMLDIYIENKYNISTIKLCPISKYILQNNHITQTTSNTHYVISFICSDLPLLTRILTILKLNY